MLASPGNGAALTAQALNATRYIDVTYQSFDGNPIDKDSILDGTQSSRSPARASRTWR